MKKSIIITILCLAGIVGGGYFGMKNFHSEANLTQIELPDVNKKIRNGKEWLGKVVIVNHWATWCAPCREEIPMLLEYQRKMADSGVQVVGIAHDLLDATRIFGDEIGITYPSMVVITGGSELLASHGNELAGALPFTAIFDRKGNIAVTKLGILTFQELDGFVQPLL